MPTLGPDGLYRDSYQLIVAKDGDGGDTFHREALLDVYEFFEGEKSYKSRLYFKLESSLTSICGNWRRHPVMWNDVLDMTRDQIEPKICAVGS